MLLLVVVVLVGRCCPRHADRECCAVLATLLLVTMVRVCWWRVVTVVTLGTAATVVAVVMVVTCDDSGDSDNIGSAGYHGWDGQMLALASTAHRSQEHPPPSAT